MKPHYHWHHAFTKQPLYINENSLILTEVNFVFFCSGHLYCDFNGELLAPHTVHNIETDQNMGTIDRYPGLSLIFEVGGDIPKNSWGLSCCSEVNMLVLYQIYLKIQGGQSLAPRPLMTPLGTSNDFSC